MCVSILHMLTHRFFTIIKCCSCFRIAGLVPNIWYQSVRGPSTRCRPSSYTPQHSVFALFEEQRRKKTSKKFASQCVRSSFGVSQPAVLCFCDCNHLRWNPLCNNQFRASFGWSTFGRISWIRPSHRCSHPKQNRPKQSASCNRYLAYNRKLIGLTPTRQHSGRPTGYVSQVTGVTLSKFSNKYPKPNRLGFKTD